MGNKDFIEKVNSMIKATFGPTVIANEQLSKYDKSAGKQNAHSPPKSKKKDPMTDLFEKVQYQFATNYIPNPPFHNKSDIEAYDVNKLKSNMQIDMTKFEQINPMLGSYNNEVRESAFPDETINKEVQKLLA